MGLNEALSLLSGVEGVAIARFTEKDVVRHPLVTRIVRAYNQAAKEPDVGLPPRYRKARAKPSGSEE